MTIFKLLLVVLAFISSGLTPAVSKEHFSIASESRDVSLTYIGTANFIVANVAGKCASTFGRDNSSKIFVLSWQERNAKYVLAAAIYMEKLLSEIHDTGGPAERDAVYQEITSAAQENGEAAMRGWFKNSDNTQACQRIAGLIEDGEFDITPQVSMYDELEALADWAQQQ